MKIDGTAGELKRIGATKGVVLGALVGLIIGLLGGSVVLSTRADTYVTATTYGLVPAGETYDETMELGQLTHLTPVVSSMATDPETIDAVQTLLGRDAGVVFAPTLISNSPLLFQVQVRAPTPDYAATAARAMEEALPNADKTRRVLEGAGAQLIVTASAPSPTSSLMIPASIIILATGLVGAFLGAGVMLRVGRHRR